MQPTSVLTKASVWYEIRVLWPNIKSVKSHNKAWGFRLQTDMNQIFQMRYCMFLQAKWIQSYQVSKFEIWKKLTFWVWGWSIKSKLDSIESGATPFFQTSNLDIWQLLELEGCRVSHLKDLYHTILKKSELQHF